MSFARAFAAAGVVAPLAGSVDRNQDMQRSNYIGRRSLPSRGAWIEIAGAPPGCARWRVAPLAGSVDRNRNCAVLLP